MSTFRSSWSSLCLWLLLAVSAAFGEQLATEEAAVSDFPGGVGLPEGYEFTAGQKAHLLAKIRGFKLDEQRRMALDFTIEAVDCNGVQLAPPISGTVQRRLAERDRNWVPVLERPVDVPPVPRAGMHAFRVQGTDKVAGRTASLEVPFDVASSSMNQPKTLPSSGSASTNPSTPKSRWRAT